MEKILVVDDEIEICNALRDFLSIKGYEVHTAQNGPAALEMVKNAKPHIVLLDIIMPGMDGMEVLTELRKTDTETGVVMVTAVTDQELGNKSLKMGANDFITKPVDLKYLETILLVKMLDFNV